MVLDMDNYVTHPRSGRCHPSVRFSGLVHYGIL